MEQFVKNETVTMDGEFERIGNWRGANGVVINLRQVIHEACIEATQKLGLKAEGLAKKHIQSQDLGWAANAPKTIAAKARKGQSNLIYVATSTYFQSITSWNDGTTAYVGVRRGTRTDKGGDLGIVAATLEFGSPARNIPARPLWQPTLEEAKKWCQQHNDPGKIAMKKLKQLMA